MKKGKKQELVIFLVIVGIAAFFRLYRLDDFASAVIGILTVIGLYLLTKELFEWRMAALAGYLMAVSFWHVGFSRTGSPAVMLPFVMVFGFYFFWRGLKHQRKFDFLMAGIFAGFASYLNIGYDLIPLIGLLVFVNYWWYLKKDFAHSDYDHAKTRFLQGVSLVVITIILVSLPVFIYYWTHDGNFLNKIPAVSLSNIIKTLGMFNFTGAPILHWTLGVFFIVGFIKEFAHWLKRKHGHFSTLHTLIISWFFISLIPGFLSPNAPDALATIGALPVVMIITTRGLWWFFEKLSAWYKVNLPGRQAGDPAYLQHERHVVIALVLIIFLATIGFVEFWRYFKKENERIFPLKNNRKRTEIKQRKS